MTTALANSASIGATSDVLCDVNLPDCNLAIWERGSLADAQDLLADSPKDVRFSCRLTELPETLDRAMRDSGFSETHAKSELLRDAQTLASLYCHAMALHRLEVRLEIVTTDSCRKWHADYVQARLITTYVGTGTQWLDARNADRVRQGEEPTQINTMSAGDVGLFKGKLATDWPAIHRSPPIAGTGEKRLLLVLNPPEAS